ncbi:dethiobiotin synthase [Alteromonas sp. ASW11-19]|uniref:ATP-dependent dethiobiotin synthetase BioD n=1 Tax=Alteromonas salexigens TaxID=2982530 RepID=A0ABT2VQ64_9ALTE|nr:dethiobiotin synthase [Alteromonas salexigens]MCU7555255.1 dethiobiotin synthase [Alteromonas salexigens]
MAAYFVTGTDTDVGKTYVSSLLLQAAAQLGKRSAGYKPVSAGCDVIDGELVNDDAVQLQRAGSLALPLSTVNPIAFTPPVAPHIAAEEAGTVISTATIESGLQHIARQTPDLLIMEGAGGWRLPIGDGRYLSDVVAALKLPVIIVVGMRLGCLNHALLTAEAVQRDGLTITGWIANQVQPDMARYAQNLATLEQLMPAPLLAEVPYQGAPDEAAMAALIKQLC